MSGLAWLGLSLLVASVIGWAFTRAKREDAALDTPENEQAIKQRMNDLEVCRAVALRRVEELNTSRRTV
jgi:hypothetical protein